MRHIAIRSLNQQLPSFNYPSANGDGEIILSSFIKLFNLNFLSTLSVIFKLLFDMLKSNVDINKLVLDTSIGSVMLVISILGIIGNLFTLCYLPRNRSQSGKLVFTLAIFDIIFLICADFLFAFPLISKKVWEHYLAKLLPLL